jgi:Tetratricopeptide repeat
MDHRLGLIGLAALLSGCSAFDMPSETEKGYAALARGDYPTAVHWLSLASAAKPDDPYLMLDLAAADQKLARFDDARKLYLTVIRIGQDTVPNHVSDESLRGKTLADIATADLLQLPQ